MGNANSRIDRFYGNYEKSFERIEKDVGRLRARGSARARRKAALGTWTTVLLVLAVGAAAAAIYQVQQQPPGTYTYHEHFARVGGAMALPGAAYALQWVLLLWLGTADARDRRKLKALEEAKRSMIKELKDMSRFEKIRTLIDKFDPDMRRATSPGGSALSPGTHRGGGPLAGVAPAPYPGMPVPPGGRVQWAQQPQVPAMLVKGSGQVAGAAALAVAGAGKAIMPLFDKLATTLISDNPVLVEDLRRAQGQLQEAQMRMAAAAQESYALRLESVALKQRLVELESQLDLPTSFDPEALQEQLQQLQEAAAQQQLPWELQGSGGSGAAAQSWQGEASSARGWSGDDGVPGSAPSTPCACSTPSAVLGGSQAPEQLERQQEQQQEQQQAPVPDVADDAEGSQGEKQPAAGGEVRKRKGAAASRQRA